MQHSKPDQLALFAQGATLARENAAFGERLAGATSVADLMSDYQALKVALGAHGLQDDIQNRYFVQQVIEQGTTAQDSFANRLSDARYSALAQTFEALGLTGAGDLRATVSAVPAALADAISAAHGDSPIALGLAGRLNGNITLGLLGADTSDKAWARAVDDPALHPILARVLGTHDNLGGLSDAAQAMIFQEATAYLYGNSSLGALSDPDNTFAVADAYLGTAGEALNSGFSYGGLRDAFVAIADGINSTNTTPQGGESVEEAVETARWEALQSDDGLRDTLAAAVGVPADFATMSSDDQIAALQSGVSGVFGRATFDVFSAQANLRTLGDHFLNPDAQPLTHVFSLGGFLEQMTAVRDADVGPEARWQAVLDIAANREAFVAAYGLDPGLSKSDDTQLIAALTAETLRRFGNEDVALFEQPAPMAALTGLYLDAQIAEITGNHVEQAFRVAVGEERPELRVALAVAEELQAAVDSGGTDDGKWYRVLGSDVLRTAFETAFGLGSEFSGLDLDQQVSILRDRSQTLIGRDTVDGYLEADKQDIFITRYLIQAGASQSVSADPGPSLFGEASANTILATLYSAGQ